MPFFSTHSPPCEARKVEDRRIVAYVETLDEGKLDSVIKYRRVSTPDEIIQPLWPALIHWFNHQTRHRRQAHAILTGLVGCAPELDLLYIQRLAAAPSQQRRCARPADEVAINDAWRTPRSSRRLDGFVVPGISVAAPASRSMGIDRARAARRTARMPQPLRFLAQAFAAVASTDQQDRPPRP
jgi:hypothetical protein